MDVQEFGVKIVTVMDESSFAKAQKKLGFFESLSKKIESVSVGFETAQSTDKFFKSMKQAYEEIRKQMNSIMRNPKLYSGTASEQQKLLDQLTKLQTASERIKKTLKDGSNSMFKIGEAASLTKTAFDRIFKNTNISSMFKDVTKSTLKWITALVGARSVWMMIRRSMSVYLSQNDELYYKLQSCYYALGSLFAPVLEFIVNLFIKLIGYVNLFARALGFAGISMKSMAKSSGSVAKMLAPFDEINNINNSSGGSGGGGNPLAGFVPNEDWAKAIEKFAAIMKDKWKEIIALILGAVAAWKLFTKFNVPFLESIGWGEFFASVTLFFADLIEFAKNPSWQTFFEILIDIAGAIGSFLVAIGALPLGWAAVIAAIIPIMLLFKDEIASWFAGIVQLFIDWWGEFKQAASTLFSELKEHWLDGWTGLGNELKTLWGNLKKGFGELWVQLMSELKQTWNDFIGSITGSYSKIKEGAKALIGVLLAWVTDMWMKMMTSASTFFHNIGSVVWNGIKSVLNNYVIRPLNNLISWINSALNFSYGGLSLFGQQIIPAFSVNIGRLGYIPSLDTGTNYVPNDMLAMIHQGEAVVPKAFNEKEYNNSEETNDLLRELINIVDSKEFRAYISNRDVGKAAVDYINQQSRILGSSVI